MSRRSCRFDLSRRWRRRSRSRSTDGSGSQHALCHSKIVAQPSLRRFPWKPVTLRYERGRRSSTSAPPPPAAVLQRRCPANSDSILITHAQTIPRSATNSPRQHRPSGIAQPACALSHGIADGFFTTLVPQARLPRPSTLISNNYSCRGTRHRSRPAASTAGSASARRRRQTLQGTPGNRASGARDGRCSTNNGIRRDGHPRRDPSRSSTSVRGERVHQIARP